MTYEYSEYLAHHGIKGQKWGVRRFQNEDGTLINPKGRQLIQKKLQEKSEKKKEESPEEAQARRDKTKKILGIAAGVAAVAAIAYLGFKADYHLTGIRDTMRSEAANLANEYGSARSRAHMGAYDSRLDAKMARYNARDTRKPVSERLLSDQEMHWKMRDTARYRQLEKSYAAQESSYRKMSQTLTRRQAASHYIKTKGHINVKHLHDYGDNVVYKKKGWDHSIIKKQSKEYRDVIRDKVHKAVRGY